MSHFYNKTQLVLGAVCIVAVGCAAGSQNAEPSAGHAVTASGAVAGTAKVYALALPPGAKGSSGDTALGFRGSKAKRAKGMLPSYVEAMLEPAELGDLSNDAGQQHLSSNRVADIMNQHVNDIFESCVLRELRKTQLSRVAIQMVISGKGEVAGATTKPGSKVFQRCVAKQLIAIKFPKFSAPRMGAEYAFRVE